MSLIQMLFPKSHFLFSLISHAAAKQLCCLPPHRDKHISTSRSIYVSQITFLLIFGHDKQYAVEKGDSFSIYEVQHLLVI